MWMELEAQQEITLYFLQLLRLAAAAVVDLAQAVALEEMAVQEAVALTKHQEHLLAAQALLVKLLKAVMVREVVMLVVVAVLAVLVQILAGQVIDRVVLGLPPALLVLR